MNTPQTNTAHWQELIEILNNVLDDRLGLTEGCREISRLSFALEPANPLFKPFIGYDSETDCFPLGEVRKHWQAEALLKTDLDRTVFEERLVSEADMNRRLRSAMDAVNLNAGRLLPLLDAERPNDPIQLLESELTVRVRGAGRDDFLWEIGSGSNWLSYHVAVTLGLQEFFLRLADCPVPNFLVYDQPSQVYFPRRLAVRGGDDEDEPIWQDQDVEAVRHILGGMSSAIAQTKNGLQVIVLDHASEDVWGGLPLVHLVEDWREGRALIPAEW